MLFNSVVLLALAATSEALSVRAIENSALYRRAAFPQNGQNQGGNNGGNNGGNQGGNNGGNGGATETCTCYGYSLSFLY